MAIVNQQLTAIQLDILTVPAGKSYAITNILVCNNNVAAAEFDMHFIPQGSSLNNAVTRVINNLQLPPGETFTFDSEKIVLDAGDRLSFVADPALAATVSYLEV
jgi:hydroxymethylpyrimidine pyrophosphatase-like HAD family hydrolase